MFSLGKLAKNLVPKLIRSVHILFFKPEMYFLGKFGPKNENYHFELKFDT